MGTTGLNYLNTEHLHYSDPHLIKKILINLQVHKSNLARAKFQNVASVIYYSNFEIVNCKKRLILWLGKAWVIKDSCVFYWSEFYPKVVVILVISQKFLTKKFKVLISIYTGSKILEQECSSFTLWYKGVYALIALRVGEKGVDGYLKPRNAHYMHFIDCCPLYYQNTSLCRGENSIPTIKVTTKINQVFFFSIQKKFQQTEKTQKPQP